MLSVVIPARNEQFLTNTIDDIFSKAKEEIEVIVVLDGYWPDPLPKIDPRLTVIHRGKPMGIRSSINAGVALAKGKYIMKSDAHCMYDEGFDVKLKADCKEDWVVVPRRYSLDPEEWCRRPKAPIDYIHLAYPEDQGKWGGVTLFNKYWKEKDRDKDLQKVLIDDLMGFQGSCYFMHRKYFHEIDLLDDVNYGMRGKEAIEVSLKCWLSKGRVVRNKKTWYAHLHKGSRYDRGHPLSREQLRKSARQINKWFIFNMAWHKQELPLRWLVDKFSAPGWENCEWDNEEWKRSLIK